MAEVSDLYVLNGREPVPAASREDYWNWRRKADRRVARSDVGGATISTVFLGLDHSLVEGPPLLFETMIFGGEHDEWLARCSTWDEAEAQHERACALVRSARPTTGEPPV